MRSQFGASPLMINLLAYPKGWCYAFKITPMLKMETSQLEAQIPNVTLNPFVRDTMKRRRSIEDEVSEFKQLPHTFFFYIGRLMLSWCSQKASSGEATMLEKSDKQESEVTFMILHHTPL